MRILLLTLFVGLGYFQSYSQLPEQWLGHYVGELTSINLNGSEINYHMELDISLRKDSSYNFTIIYGEDSLRQERAYQLLPDGNNHFLLDEKNGIVLDMSFGQDRLVSFFEVQENFLHVSYIRTKKGIRFELTSSLEGASVGGNTTELGEKIPVVQSYNTISFQYAFLKKQK